MIRHEARGLGSASVLLSVPIQQVHCDPPYRSAVLRRVFRPCAAVVLAEDDVKRPMEPVFDTPMRPDRLERERLRRFVP